MNIAIVSRFTEWMGLHMNQIAAAWRECGYQTFCFDYPTLSHKWIWRHRSFEEFNAVLLKKLQECHPDIVLLTMFHPIYDLAELRRKLPHAKICIWDFDGPNWCCLDQPNLAEADLLLTVSRNTEKVLLDRGVHAVYLPHGVDCTYYHNMGIIPAFQAQVSYIGKVRERRIAICRELAEDGLALYGRRWHKEVKEPALRSCIRSRKDVIGEDVVRIYCSSNCIINILQGKLAEEHTVLSLQVFAVPACEGCLITEKTIELEESFVPGKELFCYESKEELVDKVHWVLQNKEAARKIGQSGRQRCLKDHTQVQRVQAILALLKK